MLNDGPAEERKKQSPEQSRTSQPPTPIRAGAQQSPPAQYGPQSHGQPPPPPPPYPTGVERPPSQGLTPLQVPHQAQYPHHPPQLAQSPAVAQQYRPFETFPGSIPGARGGSHGPAYSQPSPSQHHPGMPTSAHPRVHTTSLSPTPSSHHSQTPHSIRQSPLAAMSHVPHQPTTPLGPPPPQISRSVTHPDLTFSPYHQRTYSGASNGIASGSPSQPYPPVGHHIESPNASYTRQSPHLRRTSDYSSQAERERSISVSPKTKVPPRPTSLGSRQSSFQEPYGSNRSSSQMSQGFSVAQSPGQAPQSYFGGPPPHSYAQLSNAASEVAQAPPASSQVAQNPFTPPGIPENTNPLSRQASYQHAPAPPPPLVQHNSQQKMGMSNLLTPTNEAPPTLNGSSAATAAMARESAGAQQQQPSIFMKPSPKPKKAAVSATLPHQAPPLPHHARDEQSMKIDSAQGDATEPPYTETKPSLKRPATDASLQQPPSKQRKTSGRKYEQRPPWAQLSKHNPRFHQQGPTQNGAMPQQPPQRPPAAPQSNGPSVYSNVKLDGRDPWNYDPPLDMDLIEATAALGSKWEKSFRWNTPYPDMLRVVQDWLWQHLEQLGDVGSDPREGQVEIEAKIGTLIDNNTDERLKLPVATMCVIQPDHHGNRYSFRSEMGQVS